MANAYRKIFEEEKRGPLTFAEKAAAALSGMRSFEPLLEMASRGLATDLPRGERLKAVARLSASSSTDRIFTHLESERDHIVKEALAYAFVEAYNRRLGDLDMAMCNRYSAMGAQAAVEEKHRYSSKARSQASSILDSDNLTEGARSMLETVAYRRPQV